MSDLEPAYMRQSEFARARGYTPSHVTYLKRRGLLQVVSGYVDVVATDRAVAASVTATIPQTNGHAEPDGDRRYTRGVTLVEAQARAAEARAMLTEIKARQLQGQVVERAEVVSLLQTAFTEVRTELMQLPERIVTQVRDAADEHTARQIVDRDVRATLMRCADRVRKFVQLDQPGI